MGRSVSTPTGAVAVAYREFSPDQSGDPDDIQWEWDSYIESLEEHAIELFPSLYSCDRWLDREDHAILQNAHCYVGVSEYCGCAAFWMVAKDKNDHPELSKSWCHSVAKKFESTFSEFSRTGAMSNGVSVYKAV